MSPIIQQPSSVINVTVNASPLLFGALAQIGPVTVTRSAEPLLQLDRVVEFIGDDPGTQREIFALCLDLVNGNLPLLQEAMVNGDVPTLRRLAHVARGSLGMLGLPMLQELGEEIEYRYDVLGARRWRERCLELYQLLQQLQQELQVRLAT